MNNNIYIMKSLLTHTSNNDNCTIPSNRMGLV